MLAVMTAVILSDQARDIFEMRAEAAKENIRPPTPDPAPLIPLARLRFVVNHWERMAMLGM